MAAMTKRLRERIERDFPEPGSAVAVVRLISESSEVERVQAAIVLWARGDLTKLRDACRLAREDWRDVLVRGELADDDWREKLDAELGPHEATGFETGRRTNVDTSSIATRADLAEFLEKVLADFRTGGGEAEWENATLDRFLDGLAAFAGARVWDRDDQETASWRLFAEMIAVATGYE